MPLRVAFESMELILRPHCVLLRVADPRDGEEWNRSWRPGLVKSSAPDANWHWAREIEAGASLPDRICLAACLGDRLEGLLSLSIAPSRLDRGGELLYVEYVAVAPWNRGPQRQPGVPSVRGLGTAMLQVTARLSMALGFDGRLALHSKPEAESFYEGRLGLANLGAEVVEDGEWVYFEATSEVARRLL